MSIETRPSQILDLLRNQESVEVEELSTRFGLTTQTIRNDLRELDACGLLKRTRGGARRMASVAGRAHADRRHLQRAEKAAIGRTVATLIPNACSLFINIGTTTEQVARALVRHSGLMVLINNINIITLLSGTPDKDLVLVGGKVRQGDGAVVGEDAVEFIDRYKVDYAVIGASSLDADGTVLDFDGREVSVARAILRNARTRFLVADSSKFAVNAPVRICEIAEVDCFVTDVAPPPPFIQAAKNGNTKIILTDSEGQSRVEAD